jgi:uncharacterized ParB-like nuclease family protein
VFPEACAFELSDIGPQGEPLFRYSEDQPRDPNGEFASSGVNNDVWKGDKYGVILTKDVFGIKPDLKTGLKVKKQVPMIETIPVKSLIPTQKDLDAYKLKDTSGVKDAKPIAVLKKDGKYYIIDGHHRVAAYIKNGDTQITVKVFTKDVKRDAALEDIDFRTVEGKRSLTTVFAQAEMRYSPDQPRDPDGKFGSSTVGGAVSINDKEFEHQQVLSSHMQEALKNGSVESYSAFKAASDSMKNNMASTNLTDRAKDDAINNLKEHVKAAEKYGDKNAAAAFNAGIESLSR